MSYTLSHIVGHFESKWYVSTKRFSLFTTNYRPSTNIHYITPRAVSPFSVYTMLTNDLNFTFLAWFLPKSAFIKWRFILELQSGQVTSRINSMLKWANVLKTRARTPKAGTLHLRCILNRVVPFLDNSWYINEIRQLFHLITMGIGNHTDLDVLHRSGSFWDYLLPSRRPNSII